VEREKLWRELKEIRQESKLRPSTDYGDLMAQSIRNGAGPFGARIDRRAPLQPNREILCHGKIFH